MEEENLREKTPEELTVLWFNTPNNTEEKSKIERVMSEKCPESLPLEIRKKYHKDATF